jgi:hypothetical protein
MDRSEGIENLYGFRAHKPRESHGRHIAML